MESTLQLKHSLLSTIGGINDRNLIVAITEFVRKSLAKPQARGKDNTPYIDVAPEIWNIVKRVHPVDVTDERAEYREYLNQKYK